MSLEQFQVLEAAVKETGQALAALDSPMSANDRTAILKGLPHVLNAVMSMIAIKHTGVERLMAELDEQRGEG